jgi:hypothetical protein
LIVNDLKPVFEKAPINLVVGSHGLQQDGFLSALFYKLKNDAEVIPGTACPRAGKLAF